MEANTSSNNKNLKSCIDVIDKLREIEQQQIYLRSQYHSSLDLKNKIKDRCDCICIWFFFTVF